jgi:hypothetical protein
VLVLIPYPTIHNYYFLFYIIYSKLANFYKFYTGNWTVNYEGTVFYIEIYFEKDDLINSIIGKEGTEELFF